MTFDQFISKHLGKAMDYDGLMFADETVAMIMTSYDAEIPLAQQFEFV